MGCGQNLELVAKSVADHQRGGMVFSNFKVPEVSAIERLSASTECSESSVHCAPDMAKQRDLTGR
jgi:hypothetical protein